MEEMTLNATMPFSAYEFERLRSSIPQPLNSNGALTLIAGLATIFIYIIVLREFTPLRKLPGPFFASFTRWWLVIYVRRKQRHLDDIKLHRKYGPLVRIGPNEVSISSPSALNTIYGSNAVTSFKKGLWYDGTGGAAKDSLNLFGEREYMEKYRFQRRLLGPIYSATSMKDFEPLVNDVLTKNVNKMRQLQGKIVDIDTWCIMFVLDLMANIVFSQSVGFIDQKGGKDDGTIETLHKSWDYMHWVGYIPGLFDVNEWVARNLPLISRNHLIHVTDTFEFGTREVEARRSKKIPNDKLDLAAKLVKLHHDNPEFKKEWLRNMTMANFGAGVETTAVAISAFFYYITNFRLQEKLQEEILKARKAGKLSDPPKLGELHAELPFLEACLNESMRLHPTLGINLPRVVPKGGVEIDGVFLPEGTTVGINPWVLNRDKSVYGDDADEYKPERWIGLTDEEKGRFDRYSMRFGHGARNCPGQHLAFLIYTKMIPAILANFELFFEEPEARQPGEAKTTFFPRLRGVMMGWNNRDMDL
ncbi:hypothetical protein B7494_g6894 [Chlorociboria aeruginascens]|nr:hypothetical protein B7494_g6894 [Chlorociboria aeruginascens]